ncbi:MAG: 4-hydroxybenzoate octaprenyltransferase [Pseudomonadota bacterium]
MTVPVPPQRPSRRDRIADRRVADSVKTSWVERAPEAVRPYLRLARYDRPAGFWLLAIPCWQGLALARSGSGFEPGDFWLAVLFLIGAVAMRGAGCTYNDIVDRDLDAKVARTADRPLAAGTVSLKGAWAFLGAQCLVGLVVLIQLPPVAIFIALGSLALVAAYPFMKRITWWPQLWLGLTFNWGVLVAAASVGAFDGGLWLAVLIFYAGAILWTVGYDTIYACQDIEDDALVGVKSSARALGGRIRSGVAALYAASAFLSATGAVLAGAGLVMAVGFAAYALHLMIQALRFDPGDGPDCLARFKSNATAGLILTAGLAASALLA